MRRKVNIEEYRRRADVYFASCDEENAKSDIKQPIPKPYTLSGLLCAMELSRDEFFDLERSRAGRLLVKYTLMKIEAFIEENALSGRLSATFAQGTLKNSFGWGEKSTAESRVLSVSMSETVSELGE